MPRRRSKHVLEELGGLPWWVSLVAAALAYGTVRWLVPSVAGSSPLLKPLGAALAGNAWWFAVPFFVTAAIAALASRHRRHLFNSQTGLHSLRALSWQDFERLVGETYRRKGYAVEEVGGSAPDGGVDLVLRRDGTKVVVQCKRWRTAQVGVCLVREFYGVTVAEKAARGVFVTTGTYTPDAIAFARGKPLELVDGSALAEAVTGILTRSPGNSTPRSAPACPRCGGEMAKRVAKRGQNAGREFWGCEHYPECRGTVGTEPG